MRIPAEGPEEAKFNMAPMIDMVFLLLVFFMTASTLSQKQAEKMDLPEASKGVVPKERPDRWIVNILADGTIKSGAQVVTVEQLRELVAERVKAEPGVKIYLRADANTKHKEVKKVMSSMAASGISDFIFGVYTPSGSGGAP